LNLSADGIHGKSVKGMNRKRSVQRLGKTKRMTAKLPR